MASSPQRTYTGALHIHTDQSDGGGTLRDVVAAAKKAEIDFVVLTDHGTRGYGAENKEGWHEGVLVLCGEEVTTPEGHFLAFETREDIGAAARIEQALEDTRRQFGLAVSIHHHLANDALAGVLPPPLPLFRADLLEIWSFMDEFLTRATPRNLKQATARPEKFIFGPTRKMLWQWDRMLATRRLPVVGGLNIHQRKQALMDWKLTFPYTTAFQTICTCIQTPELPSVSLRARDLVWAALRDGRSYIVNRAVAAEKPFLFEYHAPSGKVRHMGDDAAYEPGGRFHIIVPQEAEIVIRHNGQPLFWGTGAEISFPTASPGSYRVEAFLNRRAWIISNPIRLLDDEGTRHPTVSDVT
ncbi:hypothetical protein BH09SUM1_BH09SUM1_29570 [soil metagenome]